MQFFKKILLCAFALVFLACSSKDYSPKTKIKPSKGKTEFSSRYNVKNKGKAPASLDPFISQNAQDLGHFAYKIKLDENVYLKQLFRAWNDAMPKPSKATNANLFWAVNHFKKGFDENGASRSLKWIKNLRANANVAAYASVSLPALTTKIASVRMLPSDEPLYPSKQAAKEQNFDDLQGSSLGALAPVFISHYSSDGLWAFVRTDAFWGWIKKSQLLVLNSDEAKAYQKNNFAVFIKDNAKINVLATSAASSRTISIKTKEKPAPKSGKKSDKKNLRNSRIPSKTTVQNIQIKLDFNENSITSRIGAIFPYTTQDKTHFFFDGKIGANNLEFSVPKGVGSHFLQINDQNLKSILNELIGQGYGWGGTRELRDCSLFTKDFFAVFGRYLPRNSQSQGAVGGKIDISKLSNKEKKEVLNNKALMLATLVVMPGHVMLYAGNGEVAHNVWGVRTDGGGRSVIGKAAITDLEVGKGYDDVKDSALLLSRIKSINVIVDPKKIALEHAYNTQVNSKIRFDDGYTMDYDESMMELEYPLYAPLSAPRSDGGRARNAEFFSHIYGGDENEVSKNLIKVLWLKSSKNQELLFNSKNGAAKALQRVSDELDIISKKKPELLKYLDVNGTFSWRTIAKSDELSAHSWGISLDINVQNSSYWQWSKEYKNTLPQEIIDVFERNGFIWGGRWEHFDTMHFEYRPEFMMLERLSAK